jgi:adenine-specific DNA-methyltransferase
MEKLDGKSMDIVAENIEKLKEIFPDVFTEGKVDFEALEATLGEYVEGKEERYSFNWNGKAAARRIAQTPSTGTLRPAPDESKNWDSTGNLYIEGDNLEVLKLLQKSYHKQVKMIYIDPPYNTGKDFVYKDNFKDNIKNYMEQTGQIDAEGNKLSTNSDASGRYHSNWLNMMYPRLKLARNLLKDDGVIFISIDDNEVANLRKLCDEIFGEENFLAEFIWKKRTGSNDAQNMVSLDHDYIIAYTKTLDTKLNGVLKDSSNYKNPDNDPLGAWAKDNLTCNKTASERPNLFYPIVDPQTGIEYQCNSNRVWAYEKERMERNIAEGKIIFPQNIQGTPMYKRHLSELRSNRKPYSSIINTVINTIATKENRSLLNGQYFDYPKSVDLMQQLVNQGSSTNDIILDFFSGSATTAHAVMKLNSEDEGNRKYICVQLPEETDEKSEAYKAGYKNICEIGKERIRRAGEKIKEENADKEGIENLDIGFKVFKLDSSNIKAWDPESDNLEQNLWDSIENIKSDRTSEDLMYEILLKYGLDLTLPIEELTLAGKKVYVVGLGALVICLDEAITLDTVEAIAALKEKYESDDLMRVVFRDNGFKDAEVKTNAIQILKQSGIDDVKSL